MEHEKQFYSQVIKNNQDTEIANVLKTNDECGYYKVCQSFADIALNAQIIKNDDGSLLGNFQYVDINIAKVKTITFIKNNSIKNIDEFFEILEQEYTSSISPDDKRRRSGMVMEHGTGINGYMGTFYLFDRISDNVYLDIVTDIKKQLIKDGYAANYGK